MDLFVRTPRQFRHARVGREARRSDAGRPKGISLAVERGGCRGRAGAAGRGASAGAAGGEDGRDGPEADLQVVPERPGVDVLEVELHPALEVDVVAAADLPGAGDARLHREAAPLPALVLAHLGRERRARADDAHLAARTFQNCGNSSSEVRRMKRPTRVTRGSSRHLEDRPAHLVPGAQRLEPRLGVHVHGAELEHVEGPAVAARRGAGGRRPARASRA